MSELDTFEKPDPLRDHSIGARKTELQLTAEHRQCLSRMAPLFKAHVSAIASRLRVHCSSPAEMQSPDQVNSALRFWQQAIDNLLDGSCSAEALGRLLDARPVEITPPRVISGYASVLDALETVLFSSLEGTELQSALSALRHVALYNMSIVVDSCMREREVEISRHRDLINSLEIERLVTKSLLENAPVAAARLSRDFVVLECNKEFLSAVDCLREDVIGQTLFKLARGIGAEPFAKVVESGIPHREISAPLRLAPRDVQYWDWACWPVNWQCGTNLGVTALFVDATERVTSQRQREDFVAMLSHDLKTPLIAVTRALELLLDQKIGTLNAEQTKLLSGMYQSNDALYRMVQNLLDIYLYNDGVKQLSVAAQDLVELAEDVVRELSALSEHRGVRIMVVPADNARAGVACDGNEIRRVILNLVGNAIKFTPAGGTIEVSISTGNGQGRVSVKDTGRGIAEDDVQHLFTRGFTDKRRRYSSSGLGLFLCRRIVEAHKGEIGCRSEVGKGSEFTFTTGLQLPD